jgi:hypothetical protein
MRRLAPILAIGTMITVAIVASPASATPTNAFPPGLHLTADFPYGLVQAEPSVQVMPTTGDIFVAAPASTPIGCEVWKVAPDGRSFSFRGAPDNGVGGGDCDLSAAPPASGSAEPTIAYSSLTLPNITVGRSTDGGQTWSTPNPLASQIALDDRQWMTTATDGTIYLSYHIVATNNIAVAASTDGGVTYVDRGLAIDTAHIAQALYNNELGPIVEDATSLLSPKPLYTIFTAPKTVDENVNTVAGTTYTANDGVYLATSLDGGYTWTDTPIYEGNGSETYDHIFPSLSVDKEGGLWAAWSSESHIYTAYRPPASSTWTAPARLDSTGSTANLYAWVAGGKGGFADIVWYGGTASTISDPSNQWNVYMAQVQMKPWGPATKTVTVASDHVIHTGEICTTGITCSGTSRSLLDFFQVDLTPAGRAAIAWADDSQDPGTGAAQIYVTVQCGGISATTGTLLNNTC